MKNFIDPTPGNAQTPIIITESECSTLRWKQRWKLFFHCVNSIYFEVLLWNNLFLVFPYFWWISNWIISKQCTCKDQNIICVIINAQNIVSDYPISACNLVCCVDLTSWKIRSIKIKFNFSVTRKVFSFSLLFNFTLILLCLYVRCVWVHCPATDPIAWSAAHTKKEFIWDLISQSLHTRRSALKHWNAG